MPPEGLTNHPDQNTTPNANNNRSRNNNETQQRTATATTHIIPFRSRITAGVRHEPPRNIKVTIGTRLQKGCTAILMTTRNKHETSPLTAQK
jgi:hypothetical protein